MAISLAGIVYDDSGNGITGAAVVARNSVGGTTTIQASTPAGGAWSTTSLADETYTIEVTYQGKVKKWNGTSSEIQVNRLTVAANKVLLTPTGLSFINDSSNAGMTIGLTINQAANDDEILALKSSDVAHGVTTLAETDTFAAFAKLTGSGGGVKLSGLTEATGAIQLYGVATTESTTKGGAGGGTIIIEGALKNGTGITDQGANANIVVVKNNNLTRFILDADGDSHQDVGTAWTNFDDHDDIALLDALSVEISKPDDPIRAMLADYIDTHRDVLEENKIVTFNEDGHHFINWSRANMLVIGAIRQLGREITALKQLPAPTEVYYLA